MFSMCQQIFSQGLRVVPMFVLDTNEVRSVSMKSEVEIQSETVGHRGLEGG